MRFIPLSLFCAIAATCTAPATANVATLNLVAIIPVSCAIDVGPGSISGRRITLSVRRSCNTAHDLVFTGRFAAALGDVTLRYNGRSVDMRSDHETIAQPERYYDGVDEVVIEAADGTEQDLRDYAASLAFGIETA